MAPPPLLPLTWNVPETFRKRLGTTAGSQRAMEADGHLLLVVHLPPKPNERARRGRLLWRDAEGNWRGSDTGSGPMAVRKHLEQYATEIEEFDKAEAAALTADDYLPLMEGLAPLLRSARDADLLSTDTKHGMEVAMIRRAEAQARASERIAVAANRFNLLVAFFFPIGMLGAVFGVNLQNGLEGIPPPWPIVTLVIAGILCGLFLAIHVSRASKTS